MSSGVLFRFFKVLLACGLIAGFAFWGVPQSMSSGGRSAVQSLATSVTGNPYLFPELVPGPQAIIDRVLRERGGRVDRQGLGVIITDIVRHYRPDYSPDTVRLVADSAVNILLNQLPGSIADERALNPLITLALQQAVSLLPASKVSSGYIDITKDLFSAFTWRLLCGTAVAAGALALLLSLVFRPICPQDESRRTAWVNALIGLPLLLVLAVPFHHVVMAGNLRLLIGRADFMLATVTIVGVFLTAGILLYLLLSLIVLLLPYLAEQVSILAVWRRVFHPFTLVDPIGALLHDRRIRAIIARIFQMIVKHFPQEAVR